MGADKVTVTEVEVRALKMKSVDALVAEGVANEIVVHCRETRRSRKPVVRVEHRLADEAQARSVVGR